MQRLKLAAISFVIGLILLFASVVGANHDIPERTAYCADQVAGMTANILAARGAGVPLENVLEMLGAANVKDKDAVAWLEAIKNVVRAIYADDAMGAQAENEKAFEACMAFNYKALHKESKA